MNAPVHSYFVTTSRGLVPWVAQELQTLGAKVVRPSPAGLRVRGPLEFAYRICMWSRCASRVILHLRDFNLENVDDLYAGAHEIPWEDHILASGTLAVDAVTHGEVVTHSRFAAQRIKDAVVDRMRDRFGQRPSVDTQRPDVRIHAYIRGRGCSLGIDLSGQALHRRNWRSEQGTAPLKETLAAGLIMHSGWLERAPEGEPLVDPMCGSGTIVIEAAGMLAGLAPGYRRDYFGFMGWCGHDENLWQAIVSDANERAREAKQRTYAPIMGSDVDPRMVEMARRNAERAGVDAMIEFAHQPAMAASGQFDRPYTVVTNPPYGQRIGTETQVARLYQDLGGWLRNQPECRATLLVAEAAPNERLGVSLDHSSHIDNGPIPCRIIDVDTSTLSAQTPATEASPVFAKRIAKNLRRLAPWAKRYDVTCYRIYDAEIPEFNAAIDLYGNHVHLQEYRAPRYVDPLVAAGRVEQMVQALIEVLGVDREQIHIKQRRPQGTGSRYGHFDRVGETIEVKDCDLTFLVNLTDYLDTGLFLDHRPVRRWIAQRARGRRFLNLFCYTGTASVVAATAGATTTSVDLSNTYLDWAEHNFTVNSLDTSRHRFVRADCLSWLQQARHAYDLILLDPPSYSASKSMDRTLDIQRDHVELIRASIRQLARGGEMLFSCNLQGFTLEVDALPELVFEELTQATLDPDFQRRPPIHRCWRVTQQ